MASTGSLAELVELETKHVYDVYDEIAPHFADVQHKAWPKVRQFLKELKPGALVADVGCGNGRYLKINRKTFKVGCDRCEAFVDVANQKGHEAIVADNLHLPYRDNIFDAVISVAVIHHFATVERRVQALQELARVLSPGGKLLICVWAFEQKHRRFDGQDVLVPWHKQSKGFRKRGTCNSMGTSSEFSSTSSISEDDTIRTKDSVMAETSAPQQHGTMGNTAPAISVRGGMMSTITAFCQASISSVDRPQSQKIKPAVTVPQEQRHSCADLVLNADLKNGICGCALHKASMPAPHSSLYTSPCISVECSHSTVLSNSTTDCFNETAYSSLSPKETSICSSQNSVPPFEESFPGVMARSPCHLPDLLRETQEKVPHPIRPTSLPLKHSSTRKERLHGVKHMKDRYLSSVKEQQNKNITTKPRENVARKKKSHRGARSFTAISSREGVKVGGLHNHQPGKTSCQNLQKESNLSIKRSYTHKQEASPVLSSSTPEPVFLHSTRAGVCQNHDVVKVQQKENPYKAEEPSVFGKLRTFFNKKTDDSKQPEDSSHIQQSNFEVRWGDYYNRFVTDLEQDLESFRYFSHLTMTEEGRNLLSGEFAVREFPHSSCSNGTNAGTSASSHRHDRERVQISTGNRCIVPAVAHSALHRKVNDSCLLQGEQDPKRALAAMLPNSGLTNGEWLDTGEFKATDGDDTVSIPVISNSIDGNGNYSNTVVETVLYPAEENDIGFQELCSSLPDRLLKGTSAACIRNSSSLKAVSDQDLYRSSHQRHSNGDKCPRSALVSNGVEHYCGTISAGILGQEGECCNMTTDLSTNVDCDTATAVPSHNIALPVLRDTQNCDVSGDDVFEEFSSCLSACLSNLSKGMKTSFPNPKVNGASTPKSLSCQRYYHVFKEEELGDLIREHVPSLHIVQSYYDHANWCLIAEKY